MASVFSVKEKASWCAACGKGQEEVRAAEAQRWEQSL